jgi:NTP pyrophosphatase (non-canonical NTP hydrolase)
VKELGDVMWYISTISAYLGVNLSEVANKNIEKLESRLQRNKIHGAGDNR